MLSQSISKNSVILAAFAIVTAAILSSTFISTKDQIAAQERKAAQKALLQIVPTDKHNNDMLSDVIALTEEELTRFNLKAPTNIHVAKQDNSVVAFIFTVIAPDGYSGDIKLLIGVNTNGSLAGVRTLAHKETPGLGDNIDVNKSDWILSFKGKSLSNPSKEQWKVKRDGGEFDQFTGATITPRAVVNQIKATLEYYAENKNQLLLKSNNSDTAGK